MVPKKQLRRVCEGKCGYKQIESEYEGNIYSEGYYNAESVGTTECNNATREGLEGTYKRQNRSKDVRRNFKVMAECPSSEAVGYLEL